jgi:hypothetical protein
VHRIRFVLNYDRYVFCHGTFAIVRVAWSILSSSPLGSIWQQGLAKRTIPCLPGTNHNFRALEYRGLATDYRLQSR